MRRDTHQSKGGGTKGVMSLGALALAFVMSLTPVCVTKAAADSYAGNNAARVDSYIRPCFGVLLDPELRTCRSQSRRYDGNYGNGDFYNRFRGGVVAHFDCGEGTYGLDRLLARLPAGSTVYLRGARGWRSANSLSEADLPPAYAGYSVCEFSLHLRKSIVIQPDTGAGYNEHPLVLKAPQGENCVRIEPTADQVIIRNLTLMSTRGASQSCISASGGELTLDNSNVRYDGERSAITIDAGRFNMTDTNLIARTEDSALEVNHASLYISNSRVASTFNGIRGDLTNDSRLLGVTVLQLGDWQGFERGENAKAIDLSLETNRSIITIDQTKTLFYGNGLYLSGVGEALVSNSLFYSDHAITSDLERVRILNNYIFADEIGISLERGTAYVGDNHIRLVRTAGIMKKTGAQLRAVNNHIETEKCESLTWGDIPPEQRTCTPWHKQAAFGIPGGGVDWSIHELLSEACAQDPQDAQASNVCNNFQAATFRSLSKGKHNDRPLGDLISEGCAARQATDISDAQCADFRRFQATSASGKVDPEDVQEASYRALKSICTQSPSDPSWNGLCQDFDQAQAHRNSAPYEDDDTNLALADGKEWLSQALYSNENDLYSMNSGTFMPLFDNYLPRPPYRMGTSNVAGPNSPDNPEQMQGAPPPRNPSPDKQAPRVPLPVPPIKKSY